MGASQSLDAFFGSPSLPNDSEQADVYHKLRRVEKTLWLTGPWWEHESDVSEIEAVDAHARSASKRSAALRDPFKKMSPSEALQAIPAMLDEMWVSPLVALVDGVDPVARSAGLALLSRIVQRESVAKIFIAVRGMDKVMALLDSQDEPATHLALEVIFALCAGTESVILPFCEVGLIGRLTGFVKGDNLELVLASLKVLRLTLRQNAVKAELPACKTLSVLMDLVHSPHAAIAKTAITCIGLSLPNAENLADLLRLGCIDTFLRFMTPTNANADACIFALSLIADETDTIFPRELTATTLGRMLETLRGAAKRSRAASATSFLFASLAKSSIFHAAICSETNLGILAKLLVGGSPEVLGSTAYALGTVALHANDRVRQILFQVEAPQNLMQLVILSLASSGPERDEKVARLAIFALATVTSEALVSRTGPLVQPELLSPSSGAFEPLRTSTIASCERMRGTDLLPPVFARAIGRLGAGSTYALKLLAALSTAPHVKEHMCKAESVTRMLEYMRGASAAFLPSLLVLFLECCSCDQEDREIGTSGSEDDVGVTGSSLAFSKLVETAPDALQILGALFQTHEPQHLFGLAPLLAALAAHSSRLRDDMSSSTFFVDQALSIATRLNHEALHEQVLGFLAGLTTHKNARALEQLFASDPDRIANLLQASCSTRVQLLAATLLRRLFKRLNACDVPSRAAQRHLAKLVAALSVDLMVAVAACRVWGNLFQYEDKRLAFAQIPDSVSGLVQLLQRCIGNQPVYDEQLPATIRAASANTESSSEAEEKKVVPSGLKPLYRVIRSTFRAACCEITKQSLVAAPHFLCIMELFPHVCDPIARLAIDTMSELARSKTPGLRRALAVPVVLNAIQQLLRDQERASTGHGVRPQRHVLRFLGLLARKDAAIQHLVVESRLLEALLLLLHSPSTEQHFELLAEALDALAWVCSAATSPTDVEAEAEIEDEAEVETPVEGETPARRVVATPKLVDFALRHADSALAPVACASLHLLQRLACEQPGVPRFVYDANGASVVMRALHQRPEFAVRRRACGLVRHLVHRHDGNRQQFQELGATSFLVELVTMAPVVDQEDADDEGSWRKLQVKGLQALAALCEGAGPAANAAKKELLECDQSADLVRLVRVDDTNDEGLCASWTRALAMGAVASSNNQRRLVSAGIVPLLTKLLRHSSGHVRVPTARLLAYLSEAPENRGILLDEGGEALLAAIIAGLHSKLPGLQRYAALFVANAATRHDGNKVRLGAAGAAAPLVDRLSSQRRHVLENVLLAVVKLGSHAGNKVKLGGKVCFEKLLALVHHDTLGVAKGAARALAVLVVGNDANKKFLLQCEAPVVAELSALLKGSNGAIVESAVLVLGELAPMPAQALELSRCVDVLSVVSLLTHLNPRIARAALLVVHHLTRESFNKTRFGLLECVEALVARLRLGLGGTSGADELEMVELTITCLANLSFASSNASRIAGVRDQRGGSLFLLLQLTTAALPTPVKEYLSEKEVSRLLSPQDDDMGSTNAPRQGASPVDSDKNDSCPLRGQQQELDDEEMYESMARNSPKKKEVDGRGGSPRRDKSDEPRQVCEVEARPQTLDFSAFPSLQTAVLEQTLLVLSNCADEYRTAKVADILAVAVLCQALLHSSELVARCGCYTLAGWFKQNASLQDAATKRGALQALSKLLTSTSLVVVEAAAYVLSKLAARGDNPMKLLALDVPATLVHGILRKPANVPHDRVLDRAVRLLGTLVQFPRVRQALKGEEIIADVLTPLLQLHPQTLGKNLSRLVLSLLADDSLKFFLPKKTVSLLRACFVHQATSAKTIRNVLRIFALLVTVEEHKTTITLEDSGEALGRMIQELRVGEGVLAGNEETVLGLLACIAGTRKIAVILHENDVYAKLPPYLLESEEGERVPVAVADEDVAAAVVQEQRFHTVQIAARLCKALGGELAVRRLSELEFTSLLLELLRVGLPPPPLPVAEGEDVDAVLHPTSLSRLGWECLDVLRQLCSSPYDQQVIVEEGGVEVFVAYFELWLSVTSGMAPDLFPSEGGEALVLAFAVSLAAIIRTLSAQTPSRELLVQAGGFPLVLKALGLGTPELPHAQREQLAEALAGLTALPILAPYLEASPDLVAPLFRFMVAPQTQQLAHLLLLALRAFADVMEVSAASRLYVPKITGGTIQPLPFLLSSLECSHPSAASDDSILRLLHAMRSIQRLVTDEAIARVLARLDDVPAIGSILSLVLPTLPAYDDRLQIVQLMVTETLGYMAFFGHAAQLGLGRSAVARLLAQADYAKDERVKPEHVATSIWTLALLATPQGKSVEIRVELETTANVVRGWIWEDARGLDILVGCGLRAPEYLDLPTSVVSDVLAVLTTATGEEPEAETVLAQLVSKRVCTPVASLLEAVEPDVRRPALQLLARILNKQAWASSDPVTTTSPRKSSLVDRKGNNETPDECWSAILLHLAEWMQVYAQDPQSSPLSELRDAFSCLSVLTAHDEVATRFQRGEAPRGLIELVAAALQHFGGKRLPSRPESLALIRKESACSEDATTADAVAQAVTAERARVDWTLQFKTVLHVLRVCRRLMAFSRQLGERALELRVPRALDSLVLLHDRRILDEALRCMLHLTALRGEETELLFSSDRTVARFKGLLQSESRPLQARITPILSLMAANMPTLPGLCGMDGILVLADLAVSAGTVGDILAKNEGDAALPLDRRVFQDSCSMLHVLFSQEEGVVLAFDVAQVVPKLFDIVEQMTVACTASSENDNTEAPELLHLPLDVLVKVSAVPAVHVRYLELLPRICRLLDGEHGPAKLTGRWCEMLLSILFNVFGCPFGDSNSAVAKASVETLAQGKSALLPQLLPLDRWLSVVDSFPALGRFVIELIRAFVGNGELSSPYTALFNSGEDIPALLKLVGSPSDVVAIPSAQLLLAVLKQRDVRVALIVADGVAALVAALCQAKNVKVQNLLLVLILDLSRGDTEVQALLLTAPGCVAQLVEFVQEWVNVHAANDKNAICSGLDKRLALTCMLLTELSRALHGPERIVEASGHLPLLALSIQQQHDDDIQGAQTTVQILTNLAVAGLTVAPGLAVSKLPAHFLSCVLSDENEAAKLSKKHALPLQRRLALTGLVALAKANRELRATLAQSGPLVELLENLLHKPEEEVGVKRVEATAALSRDALLLLYLMSTAGCADLVGHASPKILTRICGIIGQHLTLHSERDGLQDEEATPVEVTRGLKLLANLCDVAHEQEHKVAWHPQELLGLVSLLKARVAAHQTPKRQLPALRVLRGAFSLASTDDPTESFYYPLTPKLLAELLTVLLVSASRQHHDIAECIVVYAFQNDRERARESVGDNQILEQLLIVFTQPGNDAEQRASELAVVLTQVLYVSIARGFVVSQRFLAKLPALLASYAHEALLAEGGDPNQPLKRALSIYLSFVHLSCPPASAMRSGISDMLRSEGDSRRALIVLVHQLLLVHADVCLLAHPSGATLSSEDVMLWTCIVESVSPLTPALAALFTAQASTTTWMCLLRDWFKCVDAIEKPEDEVLRNSCRMLSVVAHLPVPEEETDELLAEQRSDLCSRCLALLSRGGDVLPPRVMEGALQALMDVREAWGDTVVLNGCSIFTGTPALLPKLLHAFHVPEREANRSRHLVLQLLLLLASTGYFIEEMKAAGARSAVENNPLISPDDKALPVALLGMLGYSADLNEEYARALEQFDAASSDVERRERVAYLLRFLERYALTHSPTKEQAIDSFMTYLVADAEKTQAASMGTEHEPEVTKDEQASASKLALTITSDSLASLVKISGWGPTPDRSLSTALQSGFGELYLARWDLNALLAVAFARQRGDEDNDFQERPRLAVTQIAQVLELAALVRSQLDDNAHDVVVVGQIDARWLFNAFMLVTGLSSTPDPSSQRRSDSLRLVEQVLALLHWLAVNSSTCFEDICRYAVLLRAFLAPLTPIFCGDFNDDAGHGAMELFLSLVEMTVNTLTPGAEMTASIDELLVELLKFLYAQVDNGLLQNVRARLLLCILVILQRTGDAGRTVCVAYERAMQHILWHIHASPATELQARCSWELLGSLSELNPAITALFNLDAIPVLLRECGCDPSGQQSRPSSGSWQHSKRAVAFRQAEALKCLSRAARTHDEVLLKIGEASGIATVLFGALAAGPAASTDRKSSTKGPLPVDSAGTQAHAAHLIARIAAQEDLCASLVSPENISLLIESLESVHLPVVLHALQALAHLCAFSLCLDALVRNATVPVLAQILFSPLVATPRRREIEACVLALLGKMCDRSQIVSRRIVSSNLLPKLCEFLTVEQQQLEYTQQEPQSGEFGVHNNAVWIVYSLSKDAELVPKLVSHAILETLSDQLLEYDQSTTQRKALGAMSRLAGVAEMDAEFLQSLISQAVESVRRNVPVPEAHRSVTNALAVFVAILKAGKNRRNLTQQRQQRRPPSQQQQQRHHGDSGDEVNIRQFLLKGDGLRVALDLLGAADLRVKLEAFQVVSEFVQDHPDPDEVRELLLGSEEQGGSHALLSLVRALSDEARSAAAALAASSARNRGKNDLLLAVMTFLNMLLADEVLKAKLTATTYDVVLQVVVAISATTTSNVRVLAESLKALTTMTRAGQMADLCPEAALVSSAEPLVKVLQSFSAAEGGASSASIRLNTLFLLVNFASSEQCRVRMAHCNALESLLGIIQSPGGGDATQDDQLVQLALLGVALMTSGGVSDAAAVVELSRAVGTLVRLLSSKSASIQANAVWVVSNISSEASLKGAIVARGGPTVLQAMLSENMSTGAAESNGAALPQRPSSSTMRIREYAPKAMKALGFAPIMPAGST
ncbi:Vacuolar protein 8 [Phytophthora pseudosyringae]|uniref:Vacuolar protein 8 n=1 Tax=Phytophthora pseudosyringae TaxID=221518 RepID=A0A8T1W0N9_9STRA|nr:Vacuolar protein 8 [Phytophthora pseudosyringae]